MARENGTTLSALAKAHLTISIALIDEEALFNQAQARLQGAFKCLTNRSGIGAILEKWKVLVSLLWRLAWKELALQAMERRYDAIIKATDFGNSTTTPPLGGTVQAKERCRRRSERRQVIEKTGRQIIKATERTLYAIRTLDIFCTGLLHLDEDRFGEAMVITLAVTEAEKHILNELATNVKRLLASFCK